MTQACRLGLVIVTALSSIHAAVPQKKSRIAAAFFGWPDIPAPRSGTGMQPSVASGAVGVSHRQTVSLCADLATEFAAFQIAVAEVDTTVQTRDTGFIGSGREGRPGQRDVGRRHAGFDH